MLANRLGGGIQLLVGGETATASVSRLMGCPSFDAVGPLKLTDVGHDPVHIATVLPLDRWHVPKTPVVGSDAQGDRTLERLVTMMVRLIYDVNQWRGDSVLSRRVRTVAFRAVRLIRPLSALCPCRKDRRNGNLRCPDTVRC